MILRNGFLAVRPVTAEGVPVVGGGWEVRPQAGRWFTLRRGRDLAAAWRASSVGGDALFALFGPKSWLDTVAEGRNDVMPAREAWQRRSEAPIRAWLRYWPTWRASGLYRDNEGGVVAFSNEVRDLVPEGVQIPDPEATPLPWLLDASGAVVGTVAEAEVQVTAIVRPAMNRTIRSMRDGFDLAVVLESEPARG